MLTFSDIKNVLEGIGSNITTFTKTFPLQKVLADFTMYLTQSEAYVQDYFPLVEQYDFYRYVPTTSVMINTETLDKTKSLGVPSRWTHLLKYSKVQGKTAEIN